MDENPLSQTKMMLDDMHKSKIDMADEIFVINPGGYIGSSTWSEICYARMTDKNIQSIETISDYEIDARVHEHVEMAEELAFRQYDIWSHLASDYPDPSYLLDGMATIKHKKSVTMDPWVPEDDKVPRVDYPYINHGDKSKGYDPFKVYGNKKMARFIEEIIMIEEAKYK